MMFTKANHIDRAFQHIRLFSIVFLVACGLLCGMTIYSNNARTEKATSRVFVLVNGKLFEAFAIDRKSNIEVELRDHITSFHQYFFTLSPDEIVINQNLNKALYLIDESGKKVYENLKESHYYDNVITANITETILIDSIRLDLSKSPYYFQLHGQLKIIRASSVVTRSLVTEGYVRTGDQQSDNNIHGFMIERWYILENRDLKTELR